MHPRTVARILALTFLLLPAFHPAGGAAAQQALPPTELPGLRDTNALVPGVTYRPTIPTLETLLGFPAAERAATATEIERCLRAWTNAAPDRTRLFEYARSHEGRPLHYLFVSSPANLARLDGIEADLARLGDPRRTSEAEAREIIDRTPGVAWLAHTIHGDETEGSDAALVVLHHLLAAQDPAVDKLLENLIIAVDPLMNPDGRDRFLKMVAEHRGASPNVDHESLLHSGYWPWGRGNHYLFDLNRDWLFAVHPETRGRIREIARWNPILFVDAHGMGALDTHLFSPPREPINPNLPRRKLAWNDVFAKDQAAAFDRLGLVYYTGEWAEEWYPGYSDAWVSYRGGIGILYEQARIAADGVRRPEGRILSYRESVRHHVVGALANLATASANTKRLLADLHAARRDALDPAGNYGNRTFAVLPTANRSRLRDFTALLRLQGFELFAADRELTVPRATNQLGQLLEETKLPAGTLLIPNRQPLGHLLAAFLEFDPRLSDQAIEEERRDILRLGRSRMYDSTSWNLTMMYGLEALTLQTDLPPGSRPWPADSPAEPPVTGPVGSVAWIFDGADDLSVTVAARLLERGVQVRAADKPLTLDQTTFERGAIVVTRLDNRTFAGDLAAEITRVARETGLAARGVATGLGPGDLPDLGGGHFLLLPAPRIATLARDGVSSTDYGSVWYALDHHLGIRHSQLEARRRVDLARYNVLIIPPGGADDPELLAPLREWVQAGGTLIAMGDGVSRFIGEKSDFGHVRQLPDVLGRLPEFELAILREWHARSGPLPGLTNIWAHQAPARIEYPWQVTEAAHPEEKELKRRDEWQALFMPPGAFFATRLDTNHWLTAGCPEPLPILAGRGPVLMAAGGVEAPIRFGQIFAVTNLPAVTTTNSAAADKVADKAGAKATAAADKDGDKESDKEGATAKKDGKEGKDGKEAKDSGRIGWSALPPNTRMNLRMSGLVWPEATHRLANTAWLTREGIGRGQIILFSSPPTFRGGARGTTRVFLNAAVLGPGFGTDPSFRP